MTGAAQKPLVLYAAGSLRGAFSEIAEAFERASGLKVDARFGPSGLLRETIASGAEAGVFASANMEHPEALHRDDLAGPVRRFARNRLCALVKPGLAVTPETLLAEMLDPAVKLGTSTPKADPSGDYAFEVFDRAEGIKPGAAESLRKKALLLTGGPESPPPPKDRSVYGMLVAEGKADIFLTYRTNAVAAGLENPGQQAVPLPEILAVGADYGLTVLGGAPDNAEKLAYYVLSSAGQAVLARHGFEPPG